MKKFFKKLVKWWKAETPKGWKMVQSGLMGVSACCALVWATPQHYPEFIIPYVKAANISTLAVAFLAQFKTKKEEPTNPQ